MDASPAPPPRRPRPTGGRPLPPTPRLAIPPRAPSPNPPLVPQQPEDPRQSEQQPVTPIPVRHPSLGLPTVIATTPPEKTLLVPFLHPPRAHSRSSTPHLALDFSSLSLSAPPPTHANGLLQPQSHPPSPNADEPQSESTYNLIAYNTPTLRPFAATAPKSDSPVTATSSNTNSTTSTATSLRDAISQWTTHTSDSEGSDGEAGEMITNAWKEKDFEVLSRLGEGAGGSVDKVREKATGKIMARKTIPTPSVPEQQLRRELNFLATCRHPHIVNFHGAYLSADDSLINVLMEFCEGGSLEAVRDKMRADRAIVSEKVVAKVAEGVLKGLEYLHSKKIIHRDIKPSNILLTANGVPKLIDFGVSGELVESFAGTFTGTSYYMAPERISGAKYSIRSDVWSLGLTLLELVRSEPIYPLDLGPIELLTYIVSAEPPKLEDDPANGKAWSEGMKDFIRLCLTASPTERPGPAEMLRHPWIVESEARKLNLSRWIRQVWQWDKAGEKSTSS